MLKQSLQLRRELSRANPSDKNLQIAEAEAVLYLSAASFNSAHLESIGLNLAAVDLFEKLAAENLADLQLRRKQATSLQRLAHKYFNHASGLRFESAENAEVYKKADEFVGRSIYFHERNIEMRERITLEKNSFVRDRWNLADALMMSADPLAFRSEFARAFEKLETARRIFEALLLVDPNNREAQRDLSFLYLRYGRTAAEKKDKRTARFYLVKAKETLLKMPSAELSHEDLLMIENIDKRIAALGISDE